MGDARLVMKRIPWSFRSHCFKHRKCCVACVFSADLGQGRKNTLVTDGICLESCYPITGSGNESLTSGAAGRLLSVVSGLDQGLCVLTKYFTIDLQPQVNKKILFKKIQRCGFYQGGRREPILINCPLT